MQVHDLYPVWEYSQTGTLLEVALSGQKEVRRCVDPARDSMDGVSVCFEIERNIIVE